MKKNHGTMEPSMRDTVLRYALEKYHTQAEYLWLSLPDYAVLRHTDNQKWYGLLMNVPRKKLGLSGEGITDVLELKCDPLLAGSLRKEPGILPAYHMHRENWITVVLDGTVAQEQIFFLVDQSYWLTASRPKKAGRQGPRNWLVPANPRYFDVDQAFREQDTILWKQSTQVRAGDKVFLYLAAPVSAIRYQCRAVETDIPYSFRKGKLSMERGMRIQLEHQFQDGVLNLAVMKQCGVGAVRGPRYLPERLRQKIETILQEDRV